MRVMVDMSVSLLHHGHIRLLKQARELGTVVVGLTSDAEIFKRKGYWPELPFDARKEVLSAIVYVDEVVETPWLIDSEILQTHAIDLLVHGSDNSNDIPSEKLMILPRTEGISSSEMRFRSLGAFVATKNRKALFTAGPGSLLSENLIGLQNCFGRGDPEYAAIDDRVLSRLKTLSGHAKIVRIQGSASLAIEIAIRNFMAGRILVVTTGYYADRIAAICKDASARKHITHIDVVPVETASEISGRYDWLATVYTETSIGFRNDIGTMRTIAKRVGAQLFVDATGSIGLEPAHELADVIAYSSCKGLFGLTGASFIAYNEDPQLDEFSFYMSLATHLDRTVTGPYHAICSLDGALEHYDDLRESVRIGKQEFCRRYADRLLRPLEFQPLLCTIIRGTVQARDASVVLYEPRSAPPGTSVVCHLGEGYLGKSARGDIYDRIEVLD